MAPQQKKSSSPKGQKRDLPDASFKVDENKTYKGTVVFYNKKSGFGFIEPDMKSIVPEGKVMVLWREIQTDDRWPFLHKDLKVQFKLSKFIPKSGKGCIIKARTVEMPGGGKIELQGDLDDKKEYIHSRTTRFIGKVKFYHVPKGFGYIQIEEGYVGLEELKGKDLRVVRSEIHSGSSAPALRTDMIVEFSIQKNLKGNYSAYNVTLPEGGELTRTLVEERKELSGKSFKGEVAFYNTKGRYGYIKPENLNQLPAAVKKLLEQSSVQAKNKLQKGDDKKKKKAEDLESLIYFRRGDITSSDKKAWRGTNTEFKLYTDNRGAGACEVQILA